MLILGMLICWYLRIGPTGGRAERGTKRLGAFENNERRCGVKAKPSADSN